MRETGRRGRSPSGADVDASEEGLVVPTHAHQLDDSTPCAGARDRPATWTQSPLPWWMPAHGKSNTGLENMARSGEKPVGGVRLNR
jgi:hypothetical protein